MLDNGAYSLWSRGAKVDWSKYYAWCERWLVYPTTWAVIPDVIGGTEAENDALIEEWPFGWRGAPVWHLHESIDRLLILCTKWPKVCLGSSGQFAQVGSDAWHLRLIEVFSAIVDDSGAPPTWLHMLRGLKFATGPYPFGSADSASFGRHLSENIAKYGRDKLYRKLRALDMHQPSPTFQRRKVNKLDL